MCHYLQREQFDKVDVLLCDVLMLYCDLNMCDQLMD